MSTLKPSDHVVVVGAGLAGWRFIESVRRNGFEGEITLIGDEPYLPYDRPPLSKQVLVGKWGIEQAALATDELVAQLGVSMRLGEQATALHVEATTVELGTGRSVEGTHVVIATGASARRLPYSANEELHTVRSREDVERLVRATAELSSGSPVVVIGGGFIGAEVATSLRASGLVPLILEVAELPLIGVVGPEVALWLSGLASEAGIELRNRQAITDVQRDGDGFAIRLADGSSLFAPLVVVGAGAVVNTKWLESSGLVIDNGVVVDANLLASDNVAAIGDVARFLWSSPTGPELVRIEHWQVANDHAAHLARHWTHGGDSLKMVPYFWSDQYGKKIQMLGHPRATDEVRLVNGSIDEGKWTALFSRDDIVTGAIALSQPRALMLSKKLLDQTTSVGEALAYSPWAT